MTFEPEFEDEGAEPVKSTLVVVGGNRNQQQRTLFEIDPKTSEHSERDATLLWTAIRWALPVSTLIRFVELVETNAKEIKTIHADSKSPKYRSAKQ